MKKLLIALAVIFAMCGSAYAVTTITVDAFTTPDTVTIAHLEQLRTRLVNFANNVDGGNIQNLTVTHNQLDANADPVNRWNEAFNDWVYSGLQPAIAAGLTSDISAGIAYVDGMRVKKDATSMTYASADAWIYVDISSNGTYTATAYPTGSGTIPAIAGTRLARVTTAGGNITAVLDMRTLAITLGSTQEDFIINGMNITCVTPDATVTIDAGILYHGTTRISKTSKTTLYNATAGNWWDGVVDSYAAAPGLNYIGIDSTGNIRFIGNNAPNRSDVSGNSNGRLVYWYDGVSTYWRVLGAVRVEKTNTYNTPFRSSGNVVQYYTPRICCSANNTDFFTYGFTEDAPVNAKRVKIMYAYPTGGNDNFFIRPDADSPGYQFHATETGGALGGFYAEIPVGSTRVIDYRVDNNATNCYIWVCGYEDDIR